MLITLILCMALDYITAFLAAAVFQKSKKSEHGGLESRSGWKGLCRKGITLFVILIAARLDLAAGTNFICEATMAAYLINELISIIENLGLMGIPVPAVLRRSIDLLKAGSEEIIKDELESRKSEENANQNINSN